MASSKFSYQKLRKLPSTTTSTDEDQEHAEDETEAEQQQQQVVNYMRIRRRKRWGVRVGRPRWIRNPRIRIARLGRVVRKAARKVVERIREGKPYMRDLFAGNYLMFMQVSHSSPKLANSINYSSSFDYKPYLRSAGAHYHYPVINVT